MRKHDEVNPVGYYSVHNVHEWMKLSNLDTRRNYLVVPAAEPRTWQVESQLRPDGPVASQVLTVNEDDTFTPTLLGQQLLFCYSTKHVHIKTKVPNWTHFFISEVLQRQPGCLMSYDPHRQTKPQCAALLTLLLSVLTGSLRKVSFGGAFTCRLARKKPGQMEGCSVVGAQRPETSRLSEGQRHSFSHILTDFHHISRHGCTMAV